MKKWKVSCDEKAYCPRRQENCCPCRPSVASWGWRRRKDTVAASRQCTAHTTNLEKWTSICPGIAHVPLNQQPIDFNILKSYVHSWCQWIQKHVAVVGSSYCFQNTLTYPTTIYIYFFYQTFSETRWDFQRFASHGSSSRHLRTHKPWWPRWSAKIGPWKDGPTGETYGLLIPQLSQPYGSVNTSIFIYIYMLCIYLFCFLISFVDLFIDVFI